MGSVAVGFDIDHTLAIDNKLERVAFLHLLGQVIEAGGTPLGPLAEESNAIDALLAYQRGGGCSIEDAVNRFVRERGVAPRVDFVEGFKRMALAMGETFVVPDPDAKAAIDTLAGAGVALGVLSNGWSPLQDLKARRAGFDGKVLASADIGVQKPDPRAFAELARLLEVDPCNAFYVGDDPRTDVVGALSAGFHAVWLDNEGKTYPPDVPAPSHVIRSLRELPDLVAATALR
jgi:HAD superfamily hydrolase (TIGR01509 family)